MEFKSGRGGKRAGAGRPQGTGKPIKTAAQRRQRLGIRLPGYLVDWIRAQEDNPGQVIEAALLEVHGHEIKPRSCTLWPLMISETPPRELAVTPDAFEFPCNKRRPKDQTKLDDGIANILTIIFGPEFVEKFHAAVADNRYETAGSDTCRS